MIESVHRFETNKGARIYRIHLDLFPQLSGFAHLILFDNFCVLFDVGSGFGSSNDQLESGLACIRDDYGENIAWPEISHVVISHGHIDHFGGLTFVRAKCNAPIIIHSLDRRVITHYEERLALIGLRLKAYLREAGLTEERIEGVMRMYKLNKGLFSSQPVDIVCEQMDMRLGRMEWTHVPGHCPGQVVARIDDILLTADHVLETTSPHQAPESLTLTTGLSHYLNSLAELVPMAPQVRVALGGHEGPVHDLTQRVCEIVDVHRERLLEILSQTYQDRTIEEIAHRLYPEVEGYHELLALEESGAHIEYLHQRGLLTVENYTEMEQSMREPVRYKRTEGDDRKLINTTLLAFDTAVQLMDRTAEPM